MSSGIETTLHHPSVCHSILFNAHDPYVPPESPFGKAEYCRTAAHVALADKDAFWEINYVKIFAPEPSMAKSKSETKMNVGKSMSSRGSMKGKSKKKKEIKKNDTSHTSKKQRNSDNKSKKATETSKTMI